MNVHINMISWNVLGISVFIPHNTENTQYSHYARIIKGKRVRKFTETWVKAHFIFFLQKILQQTGWPLLVLFDELID